ncbi:flagellar hook protein FlgE [Limnohabitans planktonicus]|uniref:Flagellar basal-body rod protein FlgF n=1 Tax=Limnohabitans planktonicus II-D5 TaxID=1293045 RepID=A0A2T7UAP1_9BURK|nr:flagellar hook protein FlgE [Limnohabitans planktonicus]PVE41763.1 flagellar basal-body rod protein FlgF [Limnohabitans planktonicus II-D5]|eukprot:gene30441-37658_t
MGFQYGLSGMNAASKNLDVIGNNVANANTTGFKSSRTDFSQMVGSATGSSSNLFAGQGVAVGAVSQQFLQGNVSATGNALDVAINGNGFLQLEMADASTTYTRAGSLQIDKDGQLVNRQGAKVMGFKTDPTTGAVVGRTPSAITVPLDKGIVGQKTSAITAKVNLDAQAPAYDTATNTPAYTTYSSSFDVYNSQGEAKPVNLYFVKSAPAIPNSWEVHYQVDNATPFAMAAGNLLSTVTFNNDGSFKSATPALPTIPFKEADKTTDIHASVDLKGLTQLAARFSVSKLSQDGYAAGNLNSVSIEPDGSVYARYSNGKSQSQGQLVLAKFNNSQGLVSTVGGNWIESPSSGKPVKGTPSSENFGSLQSGSLEESNVDLTAELVNMMTAQRAYQANAQTLKTQDQVMSTLVNLR